MNRDTTRIRRILLAALVTITVGALLPGELGARQAGQGDSPADDNGNLPFRTGSDGSPEVRDPRAEEVLDRMIAAHGGAESISSRSSIFVRYRITNFSYPEPLEGTVTVWFRRPFLMRKEIVYPQRKQVVIYDGERAWVDRGKGPEELGPVSSSIVKRGMQEFDTPLMYRDGSLRYLSVAKDPLGRLTQKLSWRHEGYARDLMVDSETNRLLVIGFFDSPAGAISKMQVFDDFRMVQGVLVPYRKDIFTNNQRNSETEILEIRFNDDLAREIFNPLGGSATSTAGSDLVTSAGSPD
jgi:hypothetical protein